MDQLMFRRKYDIIKASCLLMGFLSPIACSSVEGPMDHTVWVAVSAAQLNSYPSTGGVVATVPVTIQNNGTSSVWYSLCGNRLERRNGDRWDEVWAQACTEPAIQQPDAAPQGKEVAPGEQFTVDVPVQTWLGQGWTEPLGGQYRFQAGLFNEQGTLAVDTRTSDPFQFQIQVH